MSLGIALPFVKKSGDIHAAKKFSQNKTRAYS
jgi:hypothetical protein